MVGTNLKIAVFIIYLWKSKANFKNILKQHILHYAHLDHVIHFSETKEKGTDEGYEERQNTVVASALKGGRKCCILKLLNLKCLLLQTKSNLMPLCEFPVRLCWWTNWYYIGSGRQTAWRELGNKYWDLLLFKVHTFKSRSFENKIQDDTIVIFDFTLDYWVKCKSFIVIPIFFSITLLSLSTVCNLTFA